MGKWRELDQKLNNYLRLATFPIGVKLIEDMKDLEEIDRLKRPDKKLVLCQLFSYSRYYGWTMVCTKEDNICPLAEVALGLEQPYAAFSEGTFFLGRYNKTPEGAKKTAEMIPKIKFGKFKAIVSGSLNRIEFDPDLILIYGNSAQIMRIIHGSLWNEGGRITISTFGDAVCADTVAYAFTTKKLQIAIPCLGDRCFGLAKDTDLIASIPIGLIDSILEGLEGTYKAGSRYPIPFEICTPKFFAEMQSIIAGAKNA